MNPPSPSTILITGASRGIGASIAEHLAPDGHRLALCYRTDRAAADQIAATVKAAGAEAEVFQADMSDPQETRELPARVAACFGGLDAVVGNAGMTNDGPFLTLQADQISSVIQTNLTGTLRLLLSALPFLEQSAAGRIVLVSSLGGVYGTDGQVPYSASKGGLIGITHWLGELLGPKGIGVNAVAPGFIETDMTAALARERIQPFLDVSALRRIGKPEEIAQAVRFLLEPGYVQSTTIRCDGGFAR